ncbi:MAG TPA: hypothetical protein VFN87_11180 [Solirubrobacteraceae bacterium]|nr:hypothetical protein [Solirubrobacteraceae bacterium]
MGESRLDPAEVAARPVHVRGASRPLRELTLDDVRERAAELRAVTGWGPTARVAPVARAWHELAREMEAGGAARVGELPAERLVELAPRLGVVLPS